VQFGEGVGGVDDVDWRGIDVVGFCCHLQAVGRSLWLIPRGFC
jgi:hypothetical protein